MNPALQVHVCMVMSGFVHHTFKHLQESAFHDQEDCALHSIPLDGIAALIFHGVITETPEEIAEVVRLDFRKTIADAMGFPPPAEVEQDAQRIIIEALRMYVQKYQADLIKAQVNPNTLPKVAVPSSPFAQEDDVYL